MTWPEICHNSNHLWLLILFQLNIGINKNRRKKLKFPFLCTFSISYERRGSDASLTGRRRPGSDYGAADNSPFGSRRGSDASLHSLTDMNIPAQFTLSLMDQTLLAGEKAIFSVMGK